MPNDPVSGPIPRDKFVEMVNLPYGEACKAIRKYDPMFGRQPGENIKWRVKYSRTLYEEGYATIEATSEDEAEKIAADLPDYNISWSCDDSDMAQIEDVRPLP